MLFGKVISKEQEGESYGIDKGFQKTVVARVKSDPAFAQALLDEALTLFFNGEPDTAKLILRDLVNATIGFEKLAHDIQKTKQKPAPDALQVRQPDHG